METMTKGPSFLIGHFIFQALGTTGWHQEAFSNTKGLDITLPIQEGAVTYRYAYTSIGLAIYDIQIAIF